MAEAWQTIELAAVTLGVSVRTVNRYISAGKLQSRMNDGRREVFVSLPDLPADAFAALAPGIAPGLAAGMGSIPNIGGPPARLGHASSRDQSQQNAQNLPNPSAAPPLSPAPDHSSALVAMADNAADKAELAVIAYQTLARRASDQAEATRKSSQFAWSSVAAMAALIVVAVGWTSSKLTLATADADHLARQARAAEAQSQTKQREVDELRAQLASARESTANTAGQLQAIDRLQKEQHDLQLRAAQLQSQATPTTRPGGLIDRLVSALDSKQ
jgi:hypothetical protein